MKQVLVPIDGSECSLRAVQYLIDETGSGPRPRIHLVNVQPALPGEVSQFVPRDRIADFRHEQGGEALRAAIERLQQAGLPFERHDEVGPAAERIVQLAGELGCDHIVMGTHGRGALSEFLAGSTTLKVLQRTRLPVVLVK
jgi:nucleotide-binding universal stress UspA family protein